MHLHSVGSITSGCCSSMSCPVRTAGDEGNSSSKIVYGVSMLYVACLLGDRVVLCLCCSW
jgi:hypothetical protein